jgi:hypothetical protein
MNIDAVAEESPVTLAAARAEFDAEVTYLDTATFGLPAHLDALDAASRAAGTQVLLDTTQAVGWLPVGASRFAYTACAGYKWLLSPRGTAYFTINPALIGDLTPHHAGWYADDDPWSSIYGGPLRLTGDVVASMSPRRGSPGSPPLPPCGYWPRSARRPCSGMRSGWRTGSAPG